MKRTVVVGLLLSALSGLTLAPAKATFPGRNGLIASSRCSTAYFGANCEIVTMTSKGTRGKNITDTPSFERDPEWSPKGRKIVFLCFTSDEDDTTRPADLCKMNPDGSDRERLTRTRGDESSPSWSPSGKQILYELNGDIRRMQADGTSRVRLTHTPNALESDPEWSPDGSRIAFERYEWVSPAAGCDCAVFTMKPDGSDFDRLITTEKEVADPAWAPGARRLAVTVRQKLFTVGREGGNRRRLIDNPRVVSVDWSPNGRWILYTRFHVSGGSMQETSIHKIRPGGQDPTLIRRHKDHDFYQASWQPRP